MILSDTTIRESGIVEPFFERTRSNGMSFGLSMAGYDVRSNDKVHLVPGACALISVIEHIKMPLDAVGLIKDKSTLMRLGVLVANGVLEPGWEGHPTLFVKNHSTVYPVDIKCGQPVAQILFMRTDMPVGQPYVGKYQRQGSSAQAAVFETEGVREDDAA